MKTLIGPVQFLGWQATLEWQPRACWVGASWVRQGVVTDLWVCLVPCLPVHVAWWWTPPVVKCPGDWP